MWNKEEYWKNSTKSSKLFCCHTVFYKACPMVGRRERFSHWHCKWVFLLLLSFVLLFCKFWYIASGVFITDEGVQFQWRSQGLPGWATRPTGGPKWGRKWVKVWGKIGKLNRDLRKKWGKWSSCPPRTVRLATALSNLHKLGVCWAN